MERTQSPHDLAFIPVIGRHAPFRLLAGRLVGDRPRRGRHRARRLDHQRGPTRHGITRGHTIYFFDPLGNRNKVFTGGYWADPKVEPITWTADKLWQGIFYWDRQKGSFVANYT